MGTPFNFLQCFAELIAHLQSPHLMTVQHWEASEQFRSLNSLILTKPPFGAGCYHDLAIEQLTALTGLTSLKADGGTRLEVLFKVCHHGPQRFVPWMQQLKPHDINAIKTGS